MGGPCDTEITGSTAEEMMNAGALHVTQMSESGDEGHKKVLDMMKGMEQKPEEAKKWNDDFAAKFTALPEDAPQAQASDAPPAKPEDNPTT